MGEITDALRRARDLAAEPAPRGETAEGALEEASRSFAGARADEETQHRAAVIPRTKDTPWHGRAVVTEGAQVVAERYRAFALRVRATLEGLENRSVLVTSPLRSEGATTTACNLALAFASMAAERRIALVDLDLHRPRVAAELGIEFEVGFERVLSGEVPLAAACQPTDLDAFDVYPARKCRAAPHEILASYRVPAALRALSRSYDVVVIDTPPVLLFPDVGLIVPHVGACIPVVRAGYTPRSSFREMLAHLPEERLIGCFLNQCRVPRHAGGYGDYYGEPVPEVELDAGEEVEDETRSRRSRWRRSRKS